MVQADAAIFIILGVLAVLVGMAPVLGIIEDFGNTGISQHDNIEEVQRLAGIIEDQCDNLEEYGTALSTTIEIRIIDDESVVMDETSREFSMDNADTEVSFECPHRIGIDLETDENENEFGQGDWEVSISGSDETVEVEMTS